MIVTTKTERFFSVEMTAQQRQALILGLMVAVENGEGIKAQDLTGEQKEVMQDLRVSLLNAAT